MRNALKIYGCSGLTLNKGVGTEAKDFNYWFDETNTLTNTCAVNSLLVEINLLFSQLQYDRLTDDEVRDALDLIDLYTVCLQFAETLHGADLERAGNIVASMVAADTFYFDSLDNDERDKHLNDLIGRAMDSFHVGDNPTDGAAAFLDWFREHVLDLDYQGLSREQQVAAAEVLSSQAAKADNGVGAAAGVKPSTNPIENLYNFSGYYLYMYMPEARAKDVSTLVAQMRNKETEMYKYTYAGYGQLFGSKEAFDKAIATGIRKQYGSDPDQVVKELTGADGNKQIGSLAAFIAVCKTILEILGIVLALLSTVLSFVGAIVSAKWSEPADPGTGAPGFGNGEDLTDLDAYYKSQSSGGKSQSSGGNLMKYGLIGAGILLLLGLFSR